MKIYACIRVSSNTQSISRQLEEIKKLSVDIGNIYIDKESGKDFNRTNYKRLIKKLKQDDLLIIKSTVNLGKKLPYDYKRIDPKSLVF